MPKRKMNLFFKILDVSFSRRLLVPIKSRINLVVLEGFLFRFASKEKIFSNIWRSNYWGSDESLSGPGSTLEHTQNIERNAYYVW
jgi:hypothetical protein